MEVKTITDFPLVSVIITAYNRSVFLRETLETIQNQTYTNIEILVIDDGSFKVEAEKNNLLCKEFDKCTYYYKENSGQPDSRNYGVKRATGIYIAFCDDDDLWVLDKLEKQIAVLKQNTEYGLVTGCIEYINEDGTKSGNIKSHTGHSHGYVFKEFLIKNRTASITPMLRREIFDKVGFFNPDFTIGEDWEFWRRVSYYYNFYALPDVLGYVRLHGDNMSKSRVNDPLVRFLLYRKLTTTLLSWGEGKFDKKERHLISIIEWGFYKKMFNNRCPGVVKKIILFKRIGGLNVKDAFHLMLLYFKNEVFI